MPLFLSLSGPHPRTFAAEEGKGLLAKVKRVGVEVEVWDKELEEFVGCCQK